MRTLKVVGEKNFSRICEEFELSIVQIEIVRAILEKWDKLPPNEDFAASQQKKMEAALSLMQSLGDKERTDVFRTLFKVRNMFVTLSIQRQ